MLTAREVMSKAPLHVERDITVMDAARQMTENHVGSIIITASGYPVGIVTETDITTLVADGIDPKTTLIESIMSSPLFSTSPETDISEVANTMTTNHIKKMPVVEHQRVIGIVTQTDIVRHMLRLAASQTRDEKKISDVQLKDVYAATRSLHPEDVKYWYMRCLSCGNSFLNQERNGKLLMTFCPRCSGKIEYDPAPPI